MDGLPTTWTFADDKEIGYAVSGTIPRRGEHSKHYIMPHDQDDQDGFLTADEKPSGKNPVAGFYIAGTDTISYPNNLKTKRITDLVTGMVSTGKVDSEKLLSLMKDNVDPYAKESLPKVLKLVGDTEYRGLLESWDGSFGVESEAATLYTIFKYHFYNMLLSDVSNKDMKNDLIDNHMSPLLEGKCDN
jgi:acyl-homoserine lactone acylase PvdQ